MFLFSRGPGDRKYTPVYIVLHIYSSWSLRVSFLWTVDLKTQLVGGLWFFFGIYRSEFQLPVGLCFFVRCVRKTSWLTYSFGSYHKGESTSSIPPLFIAVDMSTISNTISSREQKHPSCTVEAAAVGAVAAVCCCFC